MNFGGFFLFPRPTFFLKKYNKKNTTPPPPPPLANARRQEKFSLRFRICARHKKILLKRKEYFAWLCSERAGDGAGLYFCSRVQGGSFPPPPPRLVLSPKKIGWM